MTAHDLDCFFACCVLPLGFSFFPSFESRACVCVRPFFVRSLLFSSQPILPRPLLLFTKVSAAVAAAGPRIVHWLVLPLYACAHIGLGLAFARALCCARRTWLRRRTTAGARSGAMPAFSPLSSRDGEPRDDEELMTPTAANAATDEEEARRLSIEAEETVANAARDERLIEAVISIAIASSNHRASRVPRGKRLSNFRRKKRCIQQTILCAYVPKTTSRFPNSGALPLALVDSLCSSAAAETMGGEAACLASTVGYISFYIAVLNPMQWLICPRLLEHAARGREDPGGGEKSRGALVVPAAAVVVDAGAPCCAVRLFRKLKRDAPPPVVPNNAAPLS